MSTRHETGAPGPVARGPRTAPTGLLVTIAPHGGPLQQQVYEGIRRAILDGVLPPGARLVSSRALATDLGISRTTTLLAFEQLMAEGYVVARQGAGTFVAAELPDDQPVPAIGSVRAASATPPLSARGRALASITTPALRIVGPPRAFRLGTPAVDVFPIRQWTRLVGRRLTSLTVAQLDYGEAGGFGPLRDAIAAHVRTARATRCEADQVIVVAGAQRGVDLACRILLDPGDAAWVEAPAYPGAVSALIAAGARVVPVPVDEDGLQVERGIQLAPGARLAYVSPSHQFPLGVPLSLPRRLALLGWARRAGAWVVEDDYDAEFRHGARPMPCLHGLDPDGRVIYVGSFSKTLGPGLRLGFMVVPPELVETIIAVRRASDVCPPTLEQAALADFMSEGHYDRHLRRMRGIYRERLDALEAAAREHCAGALTLRPVRTGLHAVADLHGADAAAVAQEAAGRGVEVMPLTAYACGPGPLANGLVLGFGAVRPEDLREGMARLADAIEAARRVPALSSPAPAPEQPARCLGAGQGDTARPPREQRRLSDEHSPAGVPAPAAWTRRPRQWLTCGLRRWKGSCTIEPRR